MKRKDRLINTSIIQLELERTSRLKASISTIRKYLRILRYRWKRTLPIQTYVNKKENIIKRGVWSR